MPAYSPYRSRVGIDSFFTLALQFEELQVTLIQQLTPLLFLLFHGILLCEGCEKCDTIGSIPYLHFRRTAASFNQSVNQSHTRDGESGEPDPGQAIDCQAR